MEVFVIGSWDGIKKTDQLFETTCLLIKGTHSAWVFSLANLSLHRRNLFQLILPIRRHVVWRKYSCGKSSLEKETACLTKLICLSFLFLKDVVWGRSSTYSLSQAACHHYSGTFSSCFVFTDKRFCPFKQYFKIESSFFTKKLSNNSFCG